MATPLRKHFWLVTTTFIALAMLLLASTTNLLVEFAFTPRISNMRGEQASPAEAASRPRAALEGSRLAKLTGLTLDKSPEQAPPPGGGTAMNTSLRLKLLGTLVAHDSQWSLASVEDLDAKRIRSVMTGDDLQGARVVSIERERITFLVDGREEFIRADHHGGVSPRPSWRTPRPRRRASARWVRIPMRCPAALSKTRLPIWTACSPRPVWCQPSATASPRASRSSPSRRAPSTSSSASSLVTCSGASMASRSTRPTEPWRPSCCYGALRTSSSTSSEEGARSARCTT